LPKYIETLKFFCYLYPKKNYNEKTQVFYSGEGVKKSFWVKKTTALSCRIACVLYIKGNPHFSTKINHKVDLE